MSKVFAYTCFSDALEFAESLGFKGIPFAEGRIVWSRSVAAILKDETLEFIKSKGYEITLEKEEL